MKAKFTKTHVSNAYNYSREKELVGAYTVLGKINGELREIVTCRTYMGRSRNASTVYASIWVSAPGLSVSGKGSAGGYGYHKESAAIADAIDNAGIELYGSACSGIHWKANPEYSQAAEDAAREKGARELAIYRNTFPREIPCTPKEVAAIRRKQNKERAYIGGVGDSAVRKALEAIAKAAGGKGKLVFVNH